MEFQFRMAPEVKQWAGQLTGSMQRAWGGKPYNEARRILGKIGFWTAQPGLEVACQRQLVALRYSRRDVADAATGCKRLELQIAELERRTDQPDEPDRKVMGEGQGNTAGQLAELRRQLADLQDKQDRVQAVSRQLTAQINILRDSTEAIKAAYMAAEEAARTIRHR
jgi:chromosome segregation ATPase